MLMKYMIKTTDQLTYDEKLNFCDLFRRVFGKTMTLEDFRKKYENTILGYSFHGIMSDNDIIVGCDSSIPFKYRYFQREVIFALSVDTMIDEAYRGNPFNLKKMTGMVYDALKQKDIPFVFGFPNDKVYLVRKRLLKWDDIGVLNFYILPVTFQALKKGMTTFNFLPRAYARLINTIPNTIGKLRSSTCIGPHMKHNIHIVRDGQFVKYRYNHEDIKIIKVNADCVSVYKIETEKRVRVAYILDVTPVSKIFFESTVKHIYDEEKHNIDIIMYVGRLPFKPINLYEVPKRFQPRVMHMAGKILLDDKVDKNIFDINNWAVNLSNFDVR